jgi:hypothetical protein
MQDSVSPQERARMFDEYGQEELRQEKIREVVMEIARQLLDVLDDETISLKTGLPLEIIRELRIKN